MQWIVIRLFVRCSGCLRVSTNCAQATGAASGSPCAPRSNVHLRPGQYWALPLSDGRFGCGRVMAVPAFPKDQIGVDRRRATDLRRDRGLRHPRTGPDQIRSHQQDGREPARGTTAWPRWVGGYRPQRRPRWRSAPGLALAGNPRHGRGIPSPLSLATETESGVQADSPVTLLVAADGPDGPQTAQRRSFTGVLRRTLAGCSWESGASSEPAKVISQSSPEER